MSVELLIQNNNEIYAPVVEEGVEWSTERTGSPGKITFKVHPDELLNFQEGNAVRFKYNDKNVFFGFVFSKSREKDNIISVTAYDQLRYLKNKDIFVSENKSASDIIKMIAQDFKLQVGDIDDTKYKIPSVVEDNSTLFDIIQNALDTTLQNTNEMYVLYDDFSKITLKNIANMQTDYLIDSETAENFSYSTSIDGDTYNRIKLISESDSKPRQFYIAKDNNNINSWGILQYFDKVKEGENGQAKADALLKLYNKKTRKLTIKNAKGNLNVRAGSLVAVSLAVGDIIVNNMMIVEKCKHTFKLDEHAMELTLRGGEFIV